MSLLTKEERSGKTWKRAKQGTIWRRRLAPAASLSVDPPRSHHIAPPARDSLGELQGPELSTASSPKFTNSLASTLYSAPANSTDGGRPASTPPAHALLKTSRSPSLFGYINQPTRTFMPLDGGKARPLPALLSASPASAKNPVARAGVARRPNHLLLPLFLSICARYASETIGPSLLVCLLPDT